MSRRYDYYRAQKRDAARERRLSAGGSSSRHEALLQRCYSSIRTPSSVLAAREQAEALERAFGRLPEDYRQVILLRGVVGLSRAEIARELGRSEDAVTVLLARAVARLNEILRPSLP